MLETAATYLQEMTPTEQALGAALAVLLVFIAYRWFVRRGAEGFASAAATKLAGDAKEVFDRNADAGPTEFMRAVPDSTAVTHKVTRELHKAGNLTGEAVQARLL